MKPINGQPRQLQLSAQQLACALTIEALLAQMQTAANQLGGFLGLDYAAKAVLHGMDGLNADYARMQELWDRSVVIAPAAALSVIEGKKVG